MVRGPRPHIRAWEATGAALALLAGFHFLALRVRAGGLPAGDEGSWLSVAAELARGHGFTTRWLEAHFLVPYTLPRPDDFRYPALTSLLALVFRLAGYSVEAARWTVTAVFLAFAAATWAVSRAAFGRWAGLAALWLTVCSLLQLQWNAAVYTEGLFGLVVAGLAALCLRGETDAAWKRPGWWAGLGGGVGLLYLVRPNGLLFLPGLAWLYWRRRKDGISWRHPALAFACFALVVSPWLLRTALHFGNPFHIAGNAGLLREVGQPHTYTLFQYLAQHNPWYPLQRFIFGVPRFLLTLDEFEHGLERVPLLAVAAALVLRRGFFGPFLAAGFALSAAVCAYAAYDGWAPIRYMSPMLPLVYAYGLSALPDLFQRLFQRLVHRPFPNMPAAPEGPAFAVGATGILLLLLPVFHPHRFYERRLAPDPGYPEALADHLRRLRETVPAGGRYYAGALCKVNFLAEGRDCVGLQELYDPDWFPRSMAAFHPEWVALTRAETADSAMQAALETMRAAGYTADTLDSGPLAVWFSLTPPASDPLPASNPIDPAPAPGARAPEARP
jgi:hypothetical protein